MDTMTMLFVFMALVFALGMLQARRMKNYVSYSYTSVTNQAWDKIVKAKNGVVYIEGRKFNLFPEYGVNKMYTKGLSTFFPTMITHYDFVWNNPNPIDHKTGQPAMVSPEVENALDNQAAILSAYQNQGQSAISTISGKKNMLEKYLPLIMVAAVIGVIYCVYTLSTMQSNDSVTQQAIIDIYQTLSKHGMPVGQ